jgi:hypothetical protein
MCSDITQPNSSPATPRPRSVISLLHNGAIHPSWSFTNRRKNRFFAANIEQVLGALRVDVTATGRFFDLAEELIPQQTGWAKELPFDFKCSHTQIYTERMRQPKSFGRVATIIVAMELAVKEEQAPVDVYGVMRILAGDRFVNRFDEARLKQLQDYFDGMSAQEKESRFGLMAQRSFEDVCLAHIEQSNAGMLKALASGDCLTLYTGEKLVKFVGDNFPDELHVGPILAAGQDGSSEALGRGDTVAGLRTPRTLKPEEFTPLS